jgi:hypothetical protein
MDINITLNSFKRGFFIYIIIDQNIFQMECAILLELIFFYFVIVKHWIKLNDSPFNSNLIEIMKNNTIIWSKN